MVQKHKTVAGSDLYILQSKYTGAIKIGRSGDPEARLRQLQTGSPYELRLILVLPSKGQLEPQIHKRMRKHRLRREAGEWFAYEGLGDLPDWIYEQLDLSVVDFWWRVG